MKTQVEQIQAKMFEFTKNAEAHATKGIKAAGIRARKASLELEKMLKTYRFASKRFDEAQK